jgi:3-demethoxyubiquinol 3-hydroxylase
MSSRPPRLPGDLSRAQELARMLRVDHAGEFGATRIYDGQLAVLGNRPIARAIRQMAAQEEEHKATFDALLIEHRVRPTVLSPVWHVAGFALGAATAILGERAAMACTVAVEEVIGEHYDNQVRRLRELDEGDEELAEVLAAFRDDELEHRDTGIDHHAEAAPAYPLLSGTIKAGTRVAIWLSERF